MKSAKLKSLDSPPMVEAYTINTNYKTRVDWSVGATHPMVSNVYLVDICCRSPVLGTNYFEFEWLVPKTWLRSYKGVNAVRSCPLVRVAGMHNIYTRNERTPAVYSVFSLRRPLCFGGGRVMLLK